MADVMQTVTFLLSAAGYRTGAANPGKIMPEITEPVITLNVASVDTAKRSMTIQVTVVSPMALGGSTCEEHAINVCRLLRENGAECVMFPCELNTKTELFTVPLKVTFQGNVLSGNWQLENMCHVRMGNLSLNAVETFTAWRETDENAPALPDTYWKFKIQERMDGIKQQSLPAEPFTMEVSFENSRAVFSGCALTIQRQTIENGCQRQIWEGTAETKTVDEAW